MILNADTLIYISTVVGKPILFIRNDIEQKDYYYLLDNFIPANPGNHIYDSTVVGRDLDSLLLSIGGFAHGVVTVSEQSILTKIEALPVQRFLFNGFRWIRFSG